MKMIFFILLLMPMITFADDLTHFKTDYCTNYPEGTPSKPTLWKNCCLMHDLFFWAGGTKAERNETDHGLFNCVLNTGSPVNARIIYYGVRFGSMSPIKYPDKKWNNGWRSRPDFQALTMKDVEKIEAEIQAGYSYITPNSKKEFIRHLYKRFKK
jgi:hypothetical protein